MGNINDIRLVEFGSTTRTIHLILELLRKSESLDLRYIAIGLCLSAEIRKQRLRRAHKEIHVWLHNSFSILILTPIHIND
jgi:hypothetical protein